MIPPYDFDSRGSGTIHSCAHDLVRFGMFHLKEHLPDQTPILQDSTIDRMVLERRSTGEPKGFYGPEWFCGLGLCGREKTRYDYYWYGHDGRMPGASE